MSRLGRTMAAAGRGAAWLLPAGRRDWIAAVDPGGTSCASAQSAPSQSRRPAGSSHAAPRPAAALT